MAKQATRLVPQQPHYWFKTADDAYIRTDVVAKSAACDGLPPE
jgi:hypothetical protein